MEMQVSQKNLKKILMLNDYFKPMKEYLKAVVNSKGNLNSIFVFGAGGLGKTYNTLETLNEIKKDYVYISNYTTIVSFVNFLYENKDKIIVLDDVEEIFKNGKMLNILKGVLWGAGKENKRYVTYLTTSKLLKSPSQFEFKGKIIFLLNKMPIRTSPVVNALLSRSIVYHIRFTYNELVDILKDFSKLPYKDLSDKERNEIFLYLIHNTDNISLNLNFRTLIKMYDLYIENKDNWKELSNKLITNDEKAYLVRKFLTDNLIKKQEVIQK